MAAPAASGDEAREAFRALGRQASAGLETAAHGLRERVGTLMEGQRLLGGGAAAERALLAKRAAADAASADAEALRAAPSALAEIEGAAQLLWHAAHMGEAPVSGGDLVGSVNGELRELAEIYIHRAKTFRQATESLEDGALVDPGLSAAEQDAVYLVQARAALASGFDLACQTVGARTAEGATALGRASRELADGCCEGGKRPAPRAAEGAGVEVRAGAEPQAGPAAWSAQTLEEMKGLLQDRAQGQLQATARAVGLRAGVARQGSRLLSEGGDAAATALLAKQAAVDAAARDADAVAKVVAAAAACRVSAAAARQAGAADEAEAQQRRANHYEAVAAALARQVGPPALSDAERDALRMVQAREAGRNVALQVARGAELGLGAMQDGTARGAEALRAWAAAPEGGAGLAKSPCA